MDSNRCASEKRRGAVENLEEALAVGDRAQKDFHIRQALQLLALDEQNEN